MIHLKGNNICLRALEQSDIDTLYKWENDTSIWKVSGTLVPYSRFVLEQYLLNAHQDIFTTKQLRLVIEPLDKSIPAGCIDLFEFDPHHKRAGVGIMVEGTFRGNGFASEALELLSGYAFNTLLLNQLFCNIGADNEKSLALFQKHGFEKIGIKKAWNRTAKNTFEDEWLLQLLAK
ncbi:MAG: GNAT family N-acetyltransferase [Bacteroidia bacterium]